MERRGPRLVPPQERGQPCPTYGRKGHTQFADARGGEGGGCIVGGVSISS